jgi:hypothetical protein
VLGSDVAVSVSFLYLTDCLPLVLDHLRLRLPLVPDHLRLLLVLKHLRLHLGLPLVLDCLRRSIGVVV